MLIATNIQRTHVNGLAVVCGQHLAVYRDLLFLGGKAVANHERYFGSIQADALGAIAQARGNVRQQSGVGIECYVSAIGGYRRQLANLLQLLHQEALVVFQLAVLRQQCRTRVEHYLGAVAIDNHQAIVREVANTAGAHDGGNAQRVGQHRRMRQARAFQADNARQHTRRYRGDLGHADLGAHQDYRPVRGHRFGADAAPGVIELVADMVDVFVPGFQVGVVHRPKQLGKVLDSLAQGPRQPVAGNDAFLHMPEEGRVRQ